MTSASLGLPVHARAPGKVNLYLGVGAVGDDGYHEVATVYQAVSLYEDVRVWAADDITLSFSGPIDCSGLPTDERNIAMRAAQLVADAAGVSTGVRIEIEKNVPIAGGMGGGSADAAATLIACDTLWNAGLSRERLHELAAQLGADVPFALAGGTAIGLGCGDELSPAQKKAWVNWDGGAHQVGNGAALAVSGAYVGAPGIVMDKIMGDAMPSELSDSEMDQVSYLLPMDNPALDGLPVGQVPNPLGPLGTF